MLCLQAKACMFVDRLALVIRNAAIEEVTGVELYTRFGREYFQFSSACRVLQYSHQGILGSTHYKVVVIATRHLVNPCTDLFSLGEVKWSTFYVLQFACCDQRGVYRSVLVGVNGQLMIKNGI